MIPKVEIYFFYEDMYRFFFRGVGGIKFRVSDLLLDNSMRGFRKDGGEGSGPWNIKMS